MQKIKVIDLDTGKESVYDYSNDNWRKAYACMENGSVIMWAPTSVAKNQWVITSGRKWILL